MARIHFIELAASELADTKAFYSSAFGVGFTDFGPTYASTMTGDVDLGLQADGAEAAAAPLVVFAVDDLEAALAAVSASGGAITKPIFAFPGGRRFHFKDPSGNELGVSQSDRG